MKRSDTKFKRQRVIIDKENQQKFPELSNLRRQIKQKLNILGYYQDQLGKKIKTKNIGYITALCPFHNDTNPSFSANVKTGRWRCRGACKEKGSIFKFHQKIKKIKTIKEATQELARLAGISNRKKVVARYNYRNEKEEIQYQVRRYDDKGFRVYQRTPDGKFKAGLKGVSRIPYNLSDVIDNSLVYICEGEKDADNLAEKLGVTSTTFFGSTWLEDYLKWFEGKHIRILPDNDEAGMAYAQKVATGLFNTAKSIKIVKLPGLEINGDVTDWLDNGGTKKELIKLCKETKQWDPSQIEIPKIIAGLNKKYAVVMTGSSCRILNKFRDPVFDRPTISLLRKNAFFDFYANRKEIDPETGKTLPLAQIWFNSPQRRSYNGIVFEPGGNIPGYYNLYEGLAVEPVKGDWSLFQWHIKEVIANGDEEVSEWILAWMARIVQDPGGERPGTAIVIFGAQATGKSFFATQFGKLFGSNFLHISNRNQIIGRFNSHLTNAILVVGNEVTFGGERKNIGILKAMITEDTNLCEYKGQDSFTVKNRINLIITTNNDWPIRAEKGERRFCVLRISEKKKGNKKYFRKLNMQMENGGREAMLYDLLNMDISDVDLRTIPRTEELREQIEKGMNMLENYWFERLYEGTIISKNFSPYDYSFGTEYADCDISMKMYQTKWCNRVATSVLFTDFQLYRRANRIQENVPKNHFVIKLKKLCSGLKPGQKTTLVKTCTRGHVFGNEKSTYEKIKGVNALMLPSLYLCKRQFEKNMGIKFDWRF